MDDSPIKWRVNLRSRCSVLLFGEYMAADAAPRETLLRDMKYQKMAPTLNHDRIRRAIARYLASPTHDYRILASCRETLERERDAAVNPQRRENLTFETRALDVFERSLNGLGMTGLNFELAAPSPALKIGGVSVSVQPTAHIRVRRARGADLMGAIVVDTAKGQTPKTEPAKRRTNKAMYCSAIMVHLYLLREFAADDPKASAEHSIIFHTTRQDRVCAPDNYQRMLRNFEADCRGIERAWPYISPPPGFDPDSDRYLPRSRETRVI
ncbi:hypothetical protein [Rhodopila sp.]|uniref:hypothetical protein n=1 Tax=Rhodopila sp. TaxID=2480087 RepID=UPI003D120E4F